MTLLYLRMEIKINNAMRTNNQCPASKVTSREIQVIQLISNEYSSKEIADLLFISIETVKDHRKNIRRKLNVKNVAGLIRVAFQSRLITLQQEVASAR